ncbi:transmembrane protein, putative [Medicago truncatula]|uniref:Transmembrane protein, putative n=1 Tax=Medicago truncatula TaxID=3880 RepID=G7JRA3_MEDTR|nr:transmembrane protein, putative [Medicago truncatula]
MASKCFCELAIASRCARKASCALLSAVLLVILSSWWWLNVVSRALILRRYRRTFEAKLEFLASHSTTKSVFGSASTPLKSTSGSYKSENLQFQHVWFSFSKSILISKSNYG